MPGAARSRAALRLDRWPGERFVCRKEFGDYGLIRRQIYPFEMFRSVFWGPFEKKNTVSAQTVASSFALL